MGGVFIGKVSSRGQVAIPLELRRKLGFADGERLVFVVEGDSLIVRRLSALAWGELTAPLRKRGGTA